MRGCFDVAHRSWPRPFRWRPALTRQSLLLCRPFHPSAARCPDRLQQTLCRRQQFLHRDRSRLFESRSYRARLVRWERLVRDSIASSLPQTPLMTLPRHDRLGTRLGDQADARHARVHTTAARSARPSASAWSPPWLRTRDRPCRNWCRLRERQIHRGGWPSLGR